MFKKARRLQHYALLLRQDNLIKYVLPMRRVHIKTQALLHWNLTPHLIWLARIAYLPYAFTSHL